MSKGKCTFQLIGFIFSVLILTSCDNSNAPATTSSQTGSTINAYYTKGPVTGASALLKDADSNTVAGPVTTKDGHAAFNDVAYTGLVYIVFTGGSYIDEATGDTVTLDSSFIIRSGVIDITESGTKKSTGSPLTEIGFQRAVAQNGGALNLAIVNNIIRQVADEYGLDDIDITTVTPTIPENIAGNSDEDRYAAVLVAISQQVLNSNQQANSASLLSYINDNVIIVDQSALAAAIQDLLTNTITQVYITPSLIDNITSHIGAGTPRYTLGGSVSNLAGRVVLQVNNAGTFAVDANGAFAFSEGLLNGANYNVSVSTQPAGQTCSVSNASGTVATANVTDIVVTCDHNVNYVDFANGGSPGGTYWYAGNGQWERESWYDCQSFTQTSLGESTIVLRNAADTETLEINTQTGEITSASVSEEVFGFGKLVRPESYVTCPSTSNDFSPVFSSATEVVVNSGRTLVTPLSASDADLPPEELSFSLTDNATSDNALFKITNFSEKARAACRAGNANQGNPSDPNNDSYFVVEPDVTSLAACEAACNQHPLYGGSGINCRGIEYRAQDADPTYPEPRCELWKVAIVATVPQPGYSCYTRESKTPEVLSFINAPDFRVIKDADADNVYEIEAAVSDAPDGNISTQSIRVTVVPNGEYIGRLRTACRAGTQNEGHPQDVNNSNYFTIVNDVDSRQDCQALCDAYPLIDDPSVNCTGIEYREEDADYADTLSRCELWNVPIVATTPQKEYACYVRDHVRDPYGPADSEYAGVYKVAGFVNGSFINSTMTLSQQAPGEFLWTEGANSWTLTRTADRHKLSVGSDYPNADGYVESEVFWEADEIGGIVGPSGLVYRTDWARAKLSNSQAIYRDYINNHPGELVRVTEAERQIREIKWNIADQLHTPQAYRDYKNDIGAAYGRTDEADRRIESFIAYVTAEVLKIEVDESAPAIGEDNDLELFYNLEFTKNDSKPRPDEQGWSDADILLESIWHWNPRSTIYDGRKFTSINDGADRAFLPAGNAEKTLVANETQSLRYGGLMFEYDDDPPWPNKPDCEDFDQSGSCMEPGYKVSRFFRVYPVATGNPLIPIIDGIFDDRWNGNRTWAGNAANATESLAHTYFTVPLADLEYDAPAIETKTINFGSNEQIRLSYSITKRNQEQYDKYIESNNISCDEPPLKSEKRVPRSAVNIEGPGFLIRNETDHTYSVSLNQVGPLYYGEVPPGEIFTRDTAWGHFTIDATVNLTGEQKYDNWDVAGPIAQFTAETLLTLYTAGGSASIPSIGGTINKSVTTLGAKMGSVAGAAMSKTAFGRTILGVGRKAVARAALEANRNVLIKFVGRSGALVKDMAIDSALDLAFTKDLADLIYNDEANEEYRTWRHSGFYGSTIEMYHIVGGPRLPCLNSEGDIEIRSSDLQIMSHDECKIENAYALINGVAPMCTVN